MDLGQLPRSHQPEQKPLSRKARTLSTEYASATQSADLPRASSVREHRHPSYHLATTSQMYNYEVSWSLKWWRRHSHPWHQKVASLQPALCSQPVSKRANQLPKLQPLSLLVSRHPSLQACRIGVYHLPLGAAARPSSPPQVLKLCVPGPMRIHGSPWQSNEIHEDHRMQRNL